MIPQTYPSTYESYNSRTSMVVYELTSVIGLQEWIDYIPVKNTLPSDSEVNTYANNGAIQIDSLSSSTGLQAWLNYIPVYQKSTGTAWLDYIPVYRSSTFTAVLTNSLLLRNGTGSPTYTRATIATVTDHENIVRTVLSGEARFQGARRVANQLVGPEDLVVGASWARTSVTVTAGISDPLGGTSAFSVAATLANATVLQTVGTSANQTQVSSIWMRRRTGSGTINLADAKLGAYSITITLTTEWQRFATPAATAVAAGGLAFRIVTSGDVIDVWHPQCENVTGQSNQAPAEYVSVGVPAITWPIANTDFSTDTFWTKEGGWSISGGTANFSGVSPSNIYQTVGVAGLTVEITYTISNYVSGVFRSRAGSSFGTARTANGTYTDTITAPATGIIGVEAASGSVSTVGSIDNISVRMAQHGAGVDGVKYFSTTNGNSVASNVVTEASGSPISASTLLGYLAEGARTNLCLQSNAFTTTWAPTNLTPVQNVTSPDGSANGWTFTESVDGVATSHQCIQSITVANTTAHTFSLLLKKGVRTQVYLTMVCATTVAAGLFDVNAGTVGSIIGSATITSYPNGWYRCTITGTSDSTTASVRMFSKSGGVDYTGNGSIAFYGYGAQLEAASFASTYIPTTTASVVRNADVLTYPTAGNFSDTAGTVYYEGSLFSLSTQVSIGNSASARGLIYTNGGANWFYFDGTNNLNYGPKSITTNSIVKAACSWGNSNTEGAVNGTYLSLNPRAYDGSWGFGANLDVGGTTAPSIPFFGTIRNVRIYSAQLSASQLSSITA